MNDKKWDYFSFKTAFVIGTFLIFLISQNDIVYSKEKKSKKKKHKRVIAVSFSDSIDSVDSKENSKRPKLPIKENSELNTTSSAETNKKKRCYQ
jgi:hypothetical protein